MRRDGIKNQESRITGRPFRALWRLEGAVALSLLLAGCATTGPISREVNLLKLVDPARDAVEGKWTFDGTVLVTANAKFGRLQIPFAPPEEYDVRMVAERTGGSNSIVLGLAVGSRPFMVAIDAFEDDPKSGVELIDGKSFADNDTVVAGRLLKNGVRSTIVVAVRRQSVVVTVDGRKIVDWKADYSRVGIHVKWKMPRRDALWIGAFACVYRVHELTLVPAG